jgi:translation initiation factor IF-2
VDQIKANLYGQKSEEVIETRIKPTVIRRRKKPVQLDKIAEPETGLEAETLVAEGESPAVTTGEEEIQAAAAEKAKEKITAKVTVVEDISKEKAPLETKEPVPTEAKPETEPESAGLETPEKLVPPTEIKAKKRVKKPKKKEAAAKIIQLPVTPKVIPPQEEAPEVLKPAAKVKKISRKVKPATGEPFPATEIDRKFLKKKISFRRKEVVEGQDLYARGRRTRKSKKALRAKVPATGQKTQITTAKAIKRRIKIDETIILSDLAKRMGIKAGDMIKSLMTMGVMATVNQTIDFDTAVLVAAEFNYDVERATFEEDAIIRAEKDDPEKLIERPPVVTIMGHVDHGKTSLLDVIRKTRITDFEAGGITQHIGAYHVTTDKGQIAFLDTPGHEAFTAMRARGASVTDIVVLVVAADDGVMPQTLEAINHSRAAAVPMIVAVNKIDKSNADPERVYRELAEVGLAAEDWGGDTIFVKVSAKQNLGIDELLEMILLQSEVLELKANPNKLAKGYVVESKIDSGRGAVATVLVQEGTLRAGDTVVCGVYYGKVRALLNDRGVQVDRWK